MPIDDDTHELAERARTVLAGGHHALVTLPCERSRGWVGLLDDGGEPVLLVGAESPPALGAQSSLRGRVDVPGHGGERLVLAGTLRQLPGTVETVVRRLAGVPRTVVVPGQQRQRRRGARALGRRGADLPAGQRREHQRGAAGGHGSAVARPAARALGWPPARSGRAVNLAAYALAEPDLVAAYAPELISHLNAEHADQIRQLATRGELAARPTADTADTAHTADAADAAGRSCPAGATVDLAGAAVASLDRLGMVLWRVDAEGAHEVRIRFRQPLSEPRALGVELRWLLGHVG